jgi:hypothetical protein
MIFNAHAPIAHASPPGVRQAPLHGLDATNLGLERKLGPIFLFCACVSEFPSSFVLAITSQKIELPSDACASTHMDKYTLRKSDRDELWSIAQNTEAMSGLSTNHLNWRVIPMRERT